MLKTGFLNIEASLNGYDVTFTNNGKLYSCITTNVPDNWEDLSYEELFNFTHIWLDEIKSKDFNKFNKSEKETEVVNELVSNTVKCDLLTLIDNKYYRLNTSVSLPKTLIASYVENQNDKDFIKKLDNFWYWTCQNEPNIRDMLYDWLQKDEWVITDEGMLVCYRNVVKVRSNYNTFVEDSYNKVKKVWKKSPANIYINKGEVLSLTKQETSLNLQKEYDKLTYTFTHEFSSANRLYYIIGQETTLDRSKTDSSNKTCSEGIHSMSKAYVEKHGSKYFGDGTTLCVLVNPSNIVSCPTENEYNKMRTCAIYPVCVVEWDNGKIIEPSWEIISKASKEYNEDSQIDLNEFINNSFEDLNPKFIGRLTDELKPRAIISLWN